MALIPIELNLNERDWTTEDSGFIPVAGRIYFYENHPDYAGKIVYIIGDGTSLFSALDVYSGGNIFPDGIDLPNDEKILLSNLAGDDDARIYVNAANILRIISVGGGMTFRNEAEADILTLNEDKSAEFAYTVEITASGVNPPGDGTAALHLGGSFGGGIVFDDTGLSGLWVQDSGDRLNFGTGGSGSGISVDMYIDTDDGVGINDDLAVTGALSKGSGSFKIDHPLRPETHHLVHSFVEAPRADNIYRGKIKLKKGKGKVDLDKAAGMTKGTFEALNREVQVFTTNETGFTAVKGSVVGSSLTIEAEIECADEISWMVVGERKDKHMYETKWTDKDGKVIVEPEKAIDDRVNS